MNNNQNVVVHAQAEYMVTNNDDIMDQGNLAAKYNGDNLELMANTNGKIILAQLTNDDIMELLAIPSSNIALEDRLRKDFPIRRKSSTTRRRKVHHSKPRKTSRKSTTRRSTTHRSTTRGSRSRRSRTRRNKTKHSPPTITKLLGDLD